MAQKPNWYTSVNFKKHAKTCYSEKVLQNLWKHGAGTEKERGVLVPACPPFRAFGCRDSGNRQETSQRTHHTLQTTSPIWYDALQAKTSRHKKLLFFFFFSPSEPSCWWTLKLVIQVSTPAPKHPLTSIMDVFTVLILSVFHMSACVSSIFTNILSCTLYITWYTDTHLLHIQYRCFFLFLTHCLLLSLVSFYFQFYHFLTTFMYKILVELSRST